MHRLVGGPTRFISRPVPPVMLAARDSHRSPISSHERGPPLKSIGPDAERRSNNDAVGGAWSGTRRCRHSRGVVCDRVVPEAARLHDTGAISRGHEYSEAMGRAGRGLRSVAARRSFVVRRAPLSHLGKAKRLSAFFARCRGPRSDHGINRALQNNPRPPPSHEDIVPNLRGYDGFRAGSHRQCAYVQRQHDVDGEMVLCLERPPIRVVWRIHAAPLLGISSKRRWLVRLVDTGLGERTARHTRFEGDLRVAANRGAVAESRHAERARECPSGRHRSGR